MIDKVAKNAVIVTSGSTAVINACIVGIANAWQDLNDGKLFGAIHGINGLLLNKLVVLYPRWDFQKISDISCSPSSALGSSRHSLRDESGELKIAEMGNIFRVLERRKIGYVFIIGGVQARENAYLISKYAKKNGLDISVIHIPNTVNNDLALGHHSPGFMSAAQFIVNAVTGIDLCNRAMLPGVAIDIISDRVGWLSACASLARKQATSITPAIEEYFEITAAEENTGPHLIYMPKTEFFPGKFLTEISDAMKKHNRAHVVVAEGISEQEGFRDYVEKLDGANFLKELCGTDNLDRLKPCGSGILGVILCHLVKKELKIKRVCANTFDDLQRSFPEPSKADFLEANRSGSYAARCLREGNSNTTVTIGGEKLSYSSHINHVDLSLAFDEDSDEQKIKTFPKKFITHGNMIDDEFIRYLGVGEDDLPPTIAVKVFRVIDFDQVASH